MILHLDSAQGQVRIGSPPVLLPGILLNIEVNGELLIDNAQVEGKSGSAKQVHGWGDAAVNISIMLVDNPAAGKTRFDYLKLIVDIFKKVKDGKPVIYSLQHPMAMAWNIKQLLFAKLRSSAQKERNTITIALDFTEHNPVVALSQERQDTNKNQAAAATTAKETGARIPEATKLNITEVETKFYGY